MRVFKPAPHGLVHSLASTEATELRYPASAVTSGDRIPRMADKTRLWRLVIVAIVALCAGAALDEGFHALRNGRAKSMVSAEAFQRRLRCKSLADQYVKQSSDDNSTMFVDRVEISPARNSCIAAVSRAEHGQRGTLWSYETVDILTGETLFTGLCNQNDQRSPLFCGNGRDTQLMDKRDKALEAALSKQ